MIVVMASMFCNQDTLEYPLSMTLTYKVTRLVRFAIASGIMPERETFTNVLSSTPIEKKQLVPSQIQGKKT